VFNGIFRVQMELDSRKSEAKSELKSKDITVEVGVSIPDMILP